jgi:hypothetical protein
MKILGTERGDMIAVFVVVYEGWTVVGDVEM